MLVYMEFKPFLTFFQKIIHVVYPRSEKQQLALNFGKGTLNQEPPAAAWFSWFLSKQRSKPLWHSNILGGFFGDPENGLS